MERLTFFCLGGTAYLPRSYQLIISSENYCPGRKRAGSVGPDQTFPTRIFRWMQPEQVAKSFRALLFPPSAGCFMAKYSFAALLILCNNALGGWTSGVNCRRRKILTRELCNSTSPGFASSCFIADVIVSSRLSDNAVYKSNITWSSLWSHLGENISQ